MAKFRVLKNSLLGGQVSRDAMGRTDLPQYAHACETLQNMIPLLSGGAYRRPGTTFHDIIPANIATGFVNANQSSPPRVFPFIVDRQTSYAIVLGTNRYSTLQSGVNPDGNPGGGYLQAYRASTNTNTLEALTEIFNAHPYRCKSSKIAATATDEAIYTRLGGPTAVANTGANLAAAPIIDVADSLKSYDDDVWAVQYCQAQDVLFLTHPDYQPQTVYLTAPDLISMVPYDYGLTGLNLCQSRPYINQNTTAVTMKVTWSAGQNIVGGVGTLTCSDNFFDNLHGPRTGLEPFVQPTDGAIIALAVSEGQDMTGNNTDSGILFCRITAVSNSKVCTVVFDNGVPSRYASNTTTTSWWESAWSNYRGWPRACAIFQQRLTLAGTIHQPNTLWFTSTGGFGVTTTSIFGSCKFSALGDGPDQGIPAAGATGILANGKNYATPRNWVYFPADDSQGDGQSSGPLGTQPFRISLAAASLDGIQYLSPDQQLFIGSSTQEWVCALQNGSFDVANVECTIQSHYGSDNVQAVRIGYELMFVHQKKDEIRAYQYNYFDQSFFGEPIQLFFDEFPADEEGDTNLLAGRKKYRQIDWDASRSTLWCTDTAGNLFGLTRDRKLSITTWHTHKLGGFNADHGQDQNITDNLTASNRYTDSANFLCDGSVVSICTTPNPFSGVQDLWMVVKRSYGTGDQTVYSIERMVGGNTVRESAYSVIAPGNAQEPLYVDSAVFATDTGTASERIQPVGQHLVGQLLYGTYYSKAWGLFALQAQAVVADDSPAGTYLLPADLPPDWGTIADPHTVVMGLPYSSIIKPVRIDPPSPIGTSQGAIKRPSKAYVRVFKTLMFKMGAPPPGKLEIVRFKPAALMGQSIEIFTGDKEVFLPIGYDRDGYVYITQDQPLPFTLVSISIEGAEYEQ